jgi:hypothetical protein
LSVALTWHLLLSIGSFLTSGSWLRVTLSWDAGWYEHILAGGYFDNPAAPVFYPLFPLCVWLLQHMTFHAVPDAVLGLAINSVALWLALVALYRIARKFVDGHEWLVILLFLTAPAAFFMHMFYSESLFCALAFWAYWFALERRWLPMAGLLAFLTASRLPAILFVGLCALEYWRAHQWSLKKTFTDKTVLLLLLAPLGFLGYGLFLYVVRGDFLYMFHAYKTPMGRANWPYHSFDPDLFRTVYRAVDFAFTSLTKHGHLEFTTIAPVTALAILAAASIYAVRARGDGALLPLGIFGLAAFIMFTINGNVVSVHRYVLPCIIVYLALGRVYPRNIWTKLLVWTVALVGLSEQVVLFVRYTTQHFAG